MTDNDGTRRVPVTVPILLPLGPRPQVFGTRCDEGGHIGTPRSNLLDKREANQVHDVRIERSRGLVKQITASLDRRVVTLGLRRQKEASEVTEQDAGQQLAVISDVLARLAPRLGQSRRELQMRISAS
jgi:hypothetical protein